MGNRSTVTIVLGALFAVLLFVGGAVFLSALLAVGLGLWAMGNGTQHETARVIGDTCDDALVFRPDDDGGLLPMFAELIARRQEAEEGRKLSRRERADLQRATAWILPDEASWCGQGDHWVVAVNPGFGGRLVNWFVSAVAADGPTVTVEGHRFLDDGSVLVGTVDGTLVVASDGALLDGAVKAMVATNEPTSARRAEIVTRLGDADGAGRSTTDDGVPFLVVLDALTATELRVVGRATLLPGEDAAERLDGLCAEVFAELPPDGYTCEATVDGADVVVTATVRKADELLGAWADTLEE